MASVEEEKYYMILNICSGEYAGCHYNGCHCGSKFIAKNPELILEYVVKTFSALREEFEIVQLSAELVTNDSVFMFFGDRITSIKIDNIILKTVSKIPAF